MATKKPLHEESTGKDAGNGNSRRVAAEIIERKGAEERIAVFRSFVEASGQGFGMAGLDHRVSYVNPEFCRLMGEESIEDIVGRSFKQYYTEESQQKLEDEVIPAVLEEGQWVGELTVVSTKGILTPTIATCLLLRDGKGDPLYLANVSTDIKERKRAEEELRESEELLKLTLNAVSDGGWDWNVSTGEVFYSDRWLESLGYKSDEVESHIGFWESIVHPDDMPRIWEALDAHFEGHTPYFECENRLRTKSGEYRWNLDRGRVVTRDAGGKPLRMVGTDTDITGRKRAEEAVRKSNQRLLRAQHLGKMGFLDWNAKTNDIYWSDEVYNLYGIDPQKQKASMDLTMQLVHPDDLDFVQKNLQVAVEGGNQYDIDHGL